MNKLTEFFNKKYGDKYGKISYPRTTLQIYRVYQTIKSYGIEDKGLTELLHKVELPKPRNTEEWELYVDCLYNIDDSELERKLKDAPKGTSIEEGKIYLLKENGDKIDEGTELPSIEEQVGENKTIQIFTDLATTEVSFSDDKTIVESLDTLINTVDLKINQVFRGQSYAKDNPISGNCEIQIEILKTEMNNGTKDYVCQITLTSVTDAPYKWIMLTRRTGGATSSRVCIPLTPMIADVNKEYVDDSILAVKNNPVFTDSISLGRKADSTVGKNSYAVGDNVEASGDYGSHAEGWNTTASAYGAHAEGKGTVASAYNSHAEGNSTTASGYQSHAEGWNNIAASNASHAEGGNNKVASNATCAHVEGNYNLASSKFQHVQGKYNVEDAEDKYAHVVGNGTTENERSNAHTLDWEGNGWYSGKLSQEGTPTDDKDLVTKKYLDDIKNNLLNQIFGNNIYNFQISESEFNSLYDFLYVYEEDKEQEINLNSITFDEVKEIIDGDNWYSTISFNNQIFLKVDSMGTSGITLCIKDENSSGLTFYTLYKLNKDESNNTLLSYYDYKKYNYCNYELFDSATSDKGLYLLGAKSQYASIDNDTNIIFPDVDEFIEMHLYVSTTSALNLTFSKPVKWDKELTIEANKTYELIFKYINKEVGWIGEFKVYN